MRVAARDKSLVPTTVMSPPSGREAEVEITAETGVPAVTQEDDGEWESSSDSQEALGPVVPNEEEGEEGYGEDGEAVVQNEERLEPWPRVSNRPRLPLSFILQNLKQEVPIELVRVPYSHSRRVLYGNGKWQVKLLNTVEEVDGF